MSGYNHGYSGGSDEQVFRRVRGILNKLTVENFDSLSDQLVRVGISSENVLKGIIILLFEKAVDEPKFCPIYAGVCKRLSEQGPNFEPEQPDAVLPDGSVPRKPPTFLKLLLRKCQDEFENRSRAEKLALNAGPVTGLVPGTEEHRKTLAAHAELKKYRSKMLGNIRFIGELGMRGLLSEKVLHECIRKLCDNVTTPASEDIECLCHLLKTVGLQLDHDKAKSYMDQYFARMKMMREVDLPARIKFMIDDVMEMRDNNWKERKLQQAHKEGPKSIKEIRLQAMEEQLQASGNRREKQIGLQRIRLLRQEMQHGPPGMEMEMGMGGMMGSMPPPSYMQREHGIPSQPGAFSGMRRSEPLFPEHLQQYGQGYNDGRQPQGQNYPQGPGYMASQDVRNEGMYGVPMGLNNNNNQNANNHSNNNRGRSGAHLGRLRVSNNISLRPTTDLGHGRQNQSQPVQQDNGQPTNQPGNKPGKIVTVGSKLPNERGKPKALSKEELQKKSDALLEEYLSVLDAAEAIRCFKEMKNKKYSRKLCKAAILLALDRKDSDRVNVCKLIQSFVEEKVMPSRDVLEAFEEVLPELADLAIDIPKVEAYLAMMAAQWAQSEIVELEDFGGALKMADNGAVVLGNLLVELAKIKGEAETKQSFEQSKIDLLDVLPKGKQNELELVGFAKKYGLMFLFPMLSLKEEFKNELAIRFPDAIEDSESDDVRSAVRSIFKWIQALPQEKLSAPTFLRVIAQGLIGHAAFLTTLKIKSSDSAELKKKLKEKEKQTMQSFGAILHKYAGEKTRLQIEIIYALQIFCYDQNYPKGMMLRMSGHLYDLDIVEEEAWSTWREEVNLDIPGKGDALIAINEYLNWMRTTAEESSEEEGTDDEDVESALPKKGGPRPLSEM